MVEWRTLLQPSEIVVSITQIPGDGGQRRDPGAERRRRSATSHTLSFRHPGSGLELRY